MPTLHSVVIIGTTATNITLSTPGFGFVIVPVTPGLGFTSEMGVKILTEYLRRKKLSQKFTLANKSLQEFRIILSHC